MRRWISIARSPNVMARAAKVALVVGSVLNLVNQGGALAAGDWAALDPIRGMLNFAVPYAVASYGAVGALLSKLPAAPAEEPIPRPIRRAAS